ncbi:hypothetical protein LNP74_17220 [Klebsiella pneumoniae subsp. pneumoniae]|nr:hypothetical protein [Klebsiella pneumoniae subsp. pneumoniae]
MEGFFFMAQQYKEKSAAGGELTAQQIANMNHIVAEQLHQRRPEYSVPWWWCIASSLLRHQTWLSVRNNRVC